MFKNIKDNVWLGLFVGLVLPALGFLIVYLLKTKAHLLEKDDLLYIGCVALNLLTMRYAFKVNKEKLGKGILAATFVCAYIFFFYKVRQ